MKKIIITFTLLISSVSVTNAAEVNTYVKGMTTGTDKVEVIIVGETPTCYKVSRHGNVYFIKKDNIKLSETSKDLLKSNEVNKLFTYGMKVSKLSNKVSDEKQILSDLILRNLSVK